VDPGPTAVVWPAGAIGSPRMSYRPYQEIHRRASRRVYVGKVPVGDGAPVCQA